MFSVHDTNSPKAPLSQDLVRAMEGGLFIETLNDVRGSLWNQTHVYEKLAKKIKCICTNDMLEMDACICTNFFQFNVINASIVYTRYITN